MLARRAPLLRDRMTERGSEVIDADENRFPAGSERGGWTECGKIDQRGHSLQGELPAQLENEVDRIADRVMALLGAGWRKVRIVTDHGWLLLPGGLPKVDLPAYLTATKWARCAVVTGAANPPMPVYSWYWNQDVRIASPPGIACFRAGEQYAHGGVSPQECVIPEIVVEQGVEAVRASIQSVQWRGMRCRVVVDTNDTSIRVDIRLNSKQPATSIAAAVKDVGLTSEASLVIKDDVHEGAAAAVVLLDSNGTVVDARTTSVGENV